MTVGGLRSDVMIVEVLVHLPVFPLHIVHVLPMPAHVSFHPLVAAPNEPHHFMEVQCPSLGNSNVVAED